VALQSVALVLLEDPFSVALEERRSLELDEASNPDAEPPAGVGPVGPAP
jgi:hypothetical protein